MRYLNTLTLLYNGGNRVSEDLKLFQNFPGEDGVPPYWSAPFHPTPSPKILDQRQETANAVGTEAVNECFQSFFKLSESFKGTLFYF